MANAAERTERVVTAKLDLAQQAEQESHHRLQVAKWDVNRHERLDEVDKEIAIERDRN